MGTSSSFNKIAVINFSGNVGKSTLTRHLLAPRMGGAPVVAVESINSDAASTQVVRGEAFGRLQEEMLLEERAIVDVGSSNVEKFLALMRQYRGSHEDFDLYVVPCVPAEKQQRDTMACVRALAGLGIDAPKIRLVFNMLPADQSVEAHFAPLLAFSSHERLCLSDPAASIAASELFARLRDSGQSLQEVLDDQTDFKSALAAETDRHQRMELAGRLATRRLAEDMEEIMDRAFDALVGMQSPSGCS